MREYEDTWLIDPQDLTVLLTGFDKEVRDNKFCRIGYSQWKRLKNLSLGKTQLDIAFNDEEGYFVVNYDNTLMFEYDDGSFGSYIMDHFDELNRLYIKKEERVAMRIKNDEKKENMNMTNALKFDFGPCTNDNVKISMYGLAIRNNAGTWVSYNRTSGEIVDVDIFNFDGGNFLFKMPVALKDVKAGDIVIHNKVPVFVTGVEEGKLVAVDVRAGEEKSIIPTKNMFGFDFITKVVSVLDAVQGAPTPNEPFGNMLPFLMLQDGKMDKNMALMLMMNQGNNVFANNPMMLYFMMSNDGKDCDMLPLMLMMNGGFAAPAAPKTPEV